MKTLGTRLVRLGVVLCVLAAASLAAPVFATDSRVPASAHKTPPITCRADQLGFQKPDGKWICIAADSNPCPQGQVLDKTTKPGFAECKPLPEKKAFSCPTEQLKFQKPDGKWICIAADSNPCTQGYVLDKTTKPGFAECKPLPDKRAFTCPAGQVVSQLPTGRLVCVAGP